MAVTLVATAKATNANCYITRTDADTYHSKLIAAHVTDWSGASNDTKDEAITMAAMILDETYDWVGFPTTTTQSMKWPREGIYDIEGNLIDKDTIPTFLSDANAELARWLIDKDSRGNVAGLGIDYLQASEVAIKFSNSERKLTVPDAVWIKIRYYVAENWDPKIYGGSIQLSR